MTLERIPIDYDKVEELASRGLTQAQIATALGIGTRTLGRRKRDTAEMAEAIKRGREKGVAFAASQLQSLIEQGNLGAIIFYLKVQGKWSERQQLTLSGEVATTVKAEPLEEWFKRINGDCLKLQSNTETGKSG